MPERLTRRIASIMSRLRKTNRHTEDSSSDSIDSDSSMSATTLPAHNTYYDKTRFKWRNKTRRIGTTASSTVGSTAHSKTTMQQARLSNTVYSLGNGALGTGGQGNISGSKASTSIALTATLATLGCIVLILVVLIGYFLYARKKRWGGQSSLDGSDSESRGVEGITNIGYGHHGLKGKKGDRLSIIPECTEEQEYEYVDSDKSSVLHHHIHVGQVNEYEYVDPDKSELGHTGTRSCSHANEYEYVDPAKSEVHKIANLPAIVISDENAEYVDPDKTDLTTPHVTDRPASIYQPMIHSGLDPHFYADRSDYAPGSEASSDCEDSPPEYAVILPDNSSASQIQGGDNPTYHAHSSDILHP